MRLTFTVMLPELMSGAKLQTVRKCTGPRCRWCGQGPQHIVTVQWLQPRYAKTFGGRYHWIMGEIRITSNVTKCGKMLTESDAVLDGFTDRAKLVAALASLHGITRPEVDSQDWHVLGFEWTRRFWTAQNLWALHIKDGCYCTRFDRDAIRCQINLDEKRPGLDECRFENCPKIHIDPQKPKRMRKS